MLLAGALVLAGWIAVDAARGRGVWTAVGRYVADLASRAGPTRDLGRAVREAVGVVPKRPITLRVWDYWAPSTTEDFAKYFNELEARFEASHPDVDVVYQSVPFGFVEQKLATGMIGERPPDVFQCSVWWAQAMYARGTLLRLNDYIDRTPGLQDDQFFRAALYHNRDHGDIYGIPQIFDANCLMWNLDRIEAKLDQTKAKLDQTKAKLDQAKAEQDRIKAEQDWVKAKREWAKAKRELEGLFARDENGEIDYTRIRFDAVRDWEHFRQIARTLTDRKAGRYGFEINAHRMEAGAFMGWAAANGARFQDRAGTRALFNTTAAAEAVRFLLDLYHEDRVSPPFRPVTASRELFQKGEVACSQGGTWDGKHIVRDTLGWRGFGMTAFPPGPRGKKQKTHSWGNMLVIGARCKHPDVAWDYLRLVCGLEGAKLRLTLLKQNSPRRDLYDTEEWRRMVREEPFLENIPKICASGNPLRHTQPAAVADELIPIFEHLMLNYPKIKAKWRLKHPKVETEQLKLEIARDALERAAKRVNAVYARYQRVLGDWAAADRRRREGR